MVGGEERRLFDRKLELREHEPCADGPVIVRSQMKPTPHNSNSVTR